MDWSGIKRIFAIIAAILVSAHKGDLLRKVLILHNDFNGRDAWDPMTVYMACLGNPEKAGTATSLLKKAPM